MRRLHACLSGLVVLMPLLLVLFATAFPPTESTLPSAGTTTTNADSTRNATSGIKSLWRSWYGTATHLLDAVHSPTSATPSTSDAAKGVEEAKVVREIQVLAEALKREEYQLEELLEVRAAIKRQSWTWFLDPHIRSLVDAATLKVNNQRRKVESLFDDISLHWRQLKPLHGVRSRMFLSELAVFLLAPILSILDFVASTFSFGLLFFFLLLGPVALFFATVAFSLGVSMLPMIGAGLVVLYTLEFPWFIIQYNPSALEFVVAYAPFLLATYWLASSLGRTLRPVRQFRVVEETVSTPAPTPPTPTRQQRATNVKVD